MLNIDSVKTAMDEFNAHDGAARIFMDLDAEEVWAVCYQSMDSITVYKTDRIVEVVSKTVPFRIASYQALLRMCNDLLEADGQ